MDEYFALREFAADLYNEDGLRAADIDMIADQYELESWEIAEVEAFLRELESEAFYNGADYIASMAGVDVELDRMSRALDARYWDLFFNSEKIK